MLAGVKIGAEVLFPGRGADNYAFPVGRIVGAKDVHVALWHPTFLYQDTEHPLSIYHSLMYNVAFYHIYQYNHS